MATPQAVTAVVRAARPDFKSSADKVVFAVHAILSVNGFSLRKVGDDVDDAVAQGPSSLPSEEVDATGWNQQAQGDGGSYAFLYVPEPGTQPERQEGSAAPQPPLLLLKCLPLDGGALLLVSLADTASGRPPATLELDVGRYAPSAGGGYEQLPELIARVQGALGEALEGPQAQTAAGGKATATAAATSGRPQQQQQQQQEQQRREERPDPLRDDRFPGPRRPPGWAPVGVGVGDEDLMPGGLVPPPGLGGLGGGAVPGVMPLGPRGVGGGMHVGPENPIFADRLRHPRPGGPGGLPGPGGGVPPGVRWDPINPEGLQGWSPEDFTQGGRAARDDALNDIGRPAPGRGPDWDHMFG